MQVTMFLLPWVHPHASPPDPFATDLILFSGTCPVRPFTTSLESMYILTSDHFSLHTKFMTKYTRSYAHWENSLSHCCQGFTPSESVVWQHSFLACHNTRSLRTGFSLFHKLVIGNFPCGHSCELGERWGSWQIFISSPISLPENVNSLAFQEGCQPRSAKAGGLQECGPAVPQCLCATLAKTSYNMEMEKKNPIHHINQE